MSDEIPYIIGIVGSCLTIIGSCLIIICYYKLPELKTFGNKLVMYVGVSNLIYGIDGLVEDSMNLSSIDGSEYALLCKVNGFLSLYMNECNLIWVSILSYTIYDTVKNRVRNMTKRERKFIAIGFFMPMVLSSIPFLTNSYGRQNNYCWIRSGDGEILGYYLTLILYYLPLWICILSNFGLILSTLAMLKKINIECTETYLVIRRFIYYPVVWMLCNLAGTVNQAKKLIEGESDSLLTNIAAVFVSFQGFLTAVLFLSDPRIQEAIRNRFTVADTSIDSESSHGELEEEEHNFESLKSQDIESHQNKAKLLDGVKEIDSDKSMKTREKQKIIKKEAGGGAVAAGRVVVEYSNGNGRKDLDTRIFEESKEQEVSYEGKNNQLKSNDNNSGDDHAGSGSQQRKKLRKKRRRTATQKQKFLHQGKWNRMDKIEEDSDEDEFDREMAQLNIESTDQLFLTREDAMNLYKHHKKANLSSVENANLLANSNSIHTSSHKRKNSK